MFYDKESPVKYAAGNNAIQKEDIPIHNWYRFVLSYPPHLVRMYIQRLGFRSGDLLCDPFCGTGTTLVEAKKCGVPSVGCDAHPFAVLVSRVKTNWTLDVNVLASLLRQILCKAEERMREYDLPPLNPCHLLIRESSASKKLYCLSEEEAKLLPTGFLSEIPLRRLLILRDVIEEKTKIFGIEFREFFFLGMAHVIANGAGNFAFGPEIYRTPSKPDYDVLDHFAGQANEMILEMERAQSGAYRDVPARVFLDDARRLDHIPSGLAGVITSPPYPNEKDYTRTTRVESLLLGLMRNREQLRFVKESLLRSNTRNVFASDTDADEVLEFPTIQAICKTIEQRRMQLGKTSGFEKLYHKVVAHYFGGMRRHLRALAPKLKRKAMLAYVVGDQLSFLMVPVPTAKLLSEVARAEGYKTLGCELWRERLGTKVRNAETGQRTVKVREEVLVLQKE